MSEKNLTMRSLHDLGLAAWFGGSLMGAVGLNRAGASVADPGQRLPVSSTGWARWTPVNAAAIGTHLVGAAGELIAETPRMSIQSGVGRTSLVKTGLTAAALGVTGYSRMLGKKLEKAGEVPAEGTTEPHPQTPDQVASAQRQLKVLQWAIPALTGSLVVLTAYMGEQQKPGQVFRGVLGRMSGTSRKAPMLLGMLAARRRG
ncbi:hypothetical protein ACFFWC_28355 [Plantactinospora siamensis]|uniref:DUF4235 domain-containing protein n=1 Tax=Plantactinospora siamensis TaxID=555372 RepID=A0ABV6NV23_9ACTN